VGQHWFKNSVVYGIDVKAFCDSNGDGIGDLPGLISKLPYLQELGINCVWLQPFYPSPLRDNGYDVSDYIAVHPALGTLDDFERLIQRAHASGIRVLIDLVANHTSDQHPWFQEARRDPSSPYRDYYIWAEEPPPNTDHHVVFPGVETSTWEYDEVAGAYYWHYFYRFQPGLNHQNEQVRAEFRRVIGFWLDLGVDGFRLDATALLISAKATPDPLAHLDHTILREMSDFVRACNEEAILLAEADAPPDRLDEFFGEESRMNLLFNFLLSANLFLALATEDSTPLDQVIAVLPAPPATGQWLNFLRNHDELNLDRLDPVDRERVFAAFAPDQQMQIYDRGIRRRFGSMLDGDPQRIMLALSLLFSLPGTPLLMFGDEIGMGENLTLPEREALRTPMQWDRSMNGGFSSAPRDQLYRPVIDQGPFGYHAVNVSDQRRDQDSLWHQIRRLIAQRKQLLTFGDGTWHIVRCDRGAVFTHECDCDEDRVIAVHNLGDQAQTVHLELGGASWIDVWCDQAYPPPDSESVVIGAYGYRWLQRVASS
jgi:maltose alpha-D-glucosyltransferase/alpha-amylase